LSDVSDHEVERSSLHGHVVIFDLLHDINDSVIKSQHMKELQCLTKNLMKKILFIIFIFLFIVVFLIINKDNHCLNNKAKTYKINNKNYCLLTANNQEQWQKGLMFYKNKKELKGADGMIFIFPDKERRTFWNKNTYLDLDIYWMNDEKIVGKSYLPSILKSKEIFVVKSVGEVNKVVEIVK